MSLQYLFKRANQKLYMEFELTIVVPVYNEQDNLPRVVSTFITYFETAPLSTKLLFVNDGSSDNSQEIIEEICKKDHRFEYIQFDKNHGLSTAIKAGFDTVQTPLVGYIDADLQTNPEDFNKLLQYKDHYQLITGVRTERKDSFFKNFMSKVANMIRRAFTKDGMDDTGCPLKIIHTDYAKRIPMFKGLHRFLPAMILLQNGKVIQVPIRHYPRIAGSANFGLRNRLMGPLMDCFAYLWMKRKYINYTIVKKR